MTTAYIDESGGSGLDPENVYILTATIPLSIDVDFYRSELLALKPPTSRKLHWYEADSELRSQVVTRIASFEVMHVIVESVEHDETKSERHRRKCMKELFAMLEQMGIRSVVMESRGKGSNAADRKMVRTLKVDRTVPADFEIQHRDGPFEPLLWIPDAVCGAVSERRLGNDTNLKTLYGTIEWITLPR